MTIGLLVITALAAAPRVALLELSPVELPAERASYVTEQLGVALLKEGLAVTTPSDVRALLGLERQRELLGCDVGQSCLAELSGALGAGAVVVGQLAKTGSRWRLSVKVLNASSGAATTAFTAEAEDEPALLEEVSRCARHVARALGQARTPVGPIVLGSTGGVAVVTGVVFLISAAVAWSGLQARGNEALPVERARTAATDGPVHLGLGIGLASAGVVAGVVALVWGLFAPGTETATLIVPTLEGLALGGRW